MIQFLTSVLKIKLLISIINELNKQNQYPKLLKTTFNVAPPLFTIISLTNRNESIKTNAIMLKINKSFGFFFNVTQNDKRIGLASQGKAVMCIQIIQTSQKLNLKALKNIHSFLGL